MTQFNYKLNNLVYTSDKSLNPNTNIKKISEKIFFLYLVLTIVIFLILIFSEIRLFNAFNLTMTLISSGGFLPSNSLNQIIKTNFQEIVLILSFLISMLNIFFIYNLFSKIDLIKRYHSEDIGLVLIIIIFSTVLFVTTNNLDFSEVFIVVISSISNSGISLNKIESNFSLYLLFLTIIGGSIVSNTSGIKLLRIYILLKATSNEILKLVRPNNVTNQYIFFSDKKINNENIKLSFLIFIAFFFSIFILSGILLTDNINFENSFKLSILTLTNTVNSNNYIDQYIDFGNLLTSSKISLIIFMVIGKIELISFFLIMKKIFFKN